MAKNVSVMAELAALNRGLRKNRMSSIGWSVCSSQRTKAARSTAAMANPISVTGSVQP